ncbi:NADH-quinone oxidoreductase subunit C [Actinospongicola halichondriae]|uniref:NADH-quinone oxidoreductase subunit C n=1 Tax=Actinospongicola halichondriae TaxID=3236844 RepID=UPI003D3EA1C8
MSDTTTEDEAEAVVDDTTPEPERLFDQLVTYSRGQAVLHIDRADVQTLVKKLRDDEGYNVCIDVTAVDYLTYESPRALPDGIEAERFEVVVSLLSHEHRSRLRLRMQVPADDPSVPTLFDIHPGTEASEREVYDMFGIRFEGHPDLTRILMPEDWDGHPLRKDYAVGRIPVQFKGSVTER